MDEAQANSLGAKPIAPLLAQIDAIRTHRRPAEDASASCTRAGIAAPFVVLGDSDDHNPSFVIAQYYASALGMPDRDYYLKDDARFKEAREKYRAYVQRLFALAGSNAGAGEGGGRDRLRMENALAEASLDNVALRDPQQTDHKMTFAELQKLAPAFDWSALLRGAPGCRRATSTSTSRSSCRSSTASCARRRSPTGRRTCAGTCSTRRRRRCPTISSRRSSRSTAQFLNGAREMKPRWKRCVESTDALLGEALGRKYVEKYFPPEAKARMQELVKNLRAGDEGDDRGPRLDERRRPRSAALEKLGDVQSEDRLSRTSGRTTARSRCAATRTGSPCSPARRFGVQDDHAADRQAGRSRPLGHDAADLRRVLQPDAQRDRLPGRHPAAAGLQHGGRSTPSTTARSAW